MSWRLVVHVETSPTPPDMTLSVICDLAAVVEMLTWFVSDEFYSGDWEEMLAVN